MIELGVNIDHVATVREARATWEPDPVWAAVEAHLGGAAGITIHLREDRRHIQDADVHRLKELVQIKLNLEMAATDEMVVIASEIRPQIVMLVPEGRDEITTEGGLDVDGARGRMTDVVQRLTGAGIPVSAFIDPDLRQVAAAAECGFAVCEVHTGPYAHAFHEHGRSAEMPEVAARLAEVARAGEAIIEAGMRFNAGHALNYANVQPVAALPGVRELHIGHSIVSRSIFIGMRQAVREMRSLIIEASRP
ncbi:MAG: pyridoxine 5'-phosphate synthase [Phycisphaerales bacterium]|nr:pyridoxine 5'-phosphate synthase [Phycisphaerales bacterium]